MAGKKSFIFILVRPFWSEFSFFYFSEFWIEQLQLVKTSWKNVAN